jgi:hypothetical protein
VWRPWSPLKCSKRRRLGQARERHKKGRELITLTARVWDALGQRRAQAVKGSRTNSEDGLTGAGCGWDVKGRETGKQWEKAVGGSEAQSRGGRG